MRYFRTRGVGENSILITDDAMTMYKWAGNIRKTFNIFHAFNQREESIKRIQRIYDEISEDDAFLEMI